MDAVSGCHPIGFYFRARAIGEALRKNSYGDTLMADFCGAAAENAAFHNVWADWAEEGQELRGILKGGRSGISSGIQGIELEALLKKATWVTAL